MSDLKYRFNTREKPNEDLVGRDKGAESYTAPKKDYLEWFN